MLRVFERDRVPRGAGPSKVRRIAVGIGKLRNSKLPHFAGAMEFALAS
jgi:hypothetical protein